MLEKQYKSYTGFINTVNSNYTTYLKLFNDLKNYIQYKENQVNIKETYINFNEGKSQSKIIINNLKTSTKRLDGMGIMKKFSTTSCFRDSENNDINKCEIQELRMLRKESSIFKQQMSNLLKEISSLRRFKEDYDKNLLEFQESININFKNEMDNVEKELQIYKVK